MQKLGQSRKLHCSSKLKVQIFSWSGPFNAVFMYFLSMNAKYSDNDDDVDEDVYDGLRCLAGFL